MGYKVSNLKITKQSGTDNTYFASWDFSEPVIKVSSGTVAKGTIVELCGTGGNNIVEFTNGVKATEEVKKKQWYVANVDGNNALIGKSTDGKQTLNSTVSLQYVKKVGTDSPSLVPIKNTDHFNVHWYYSTGDGVWFDGGSSSVKLKNATYSPPENAVKIRFDIRPCSTTYAVDVKNGNTTTKVTKSYWSGDVSSVTKNVEGVNTPEQLSAPTVSMKQYALTAKIENITDSKVDQVEFYILKNKKECRTAKAKVLACSATIKLTVDTGCTYDVRCRGINVLGKQTIAGEWSEWSYDTKSAPNKIDAITKLIALTTESVQIQWAKIASAESYEVQYTDHKIYFDSGSVSSTTVDANVSHAEIIGLTTGTRYYFRVRAVNSAGSSPWSPVSSIAIGTTPAAPTTWTTANSIRKGEKIRLYWQQNSEDGSKQTHAMLAIQIPPEERKEIPLDKYIGKDEVNCYYEIDTSKWSTITEIIWQVKTAGVTEKYSEWSTKRTVKVYSDPELSVTVANLSENSIFSSYPMNIQCKAYADDQTMIGCSLSIIANKTYETTNILGEKTRVNAGDTIFSRYYTVQNSNTLDIRLSAYDIDLVDSFEYELVCTASFNSGLTASVRGIVFTVQYPESAELINASTVTINYDMLIAMVSPRAVLGNGIVPEYATISVYRKEFDGTFTEIAKDIPNASYTIIDPHPALNTAVYRVVIVNNKTGAVVFDDMSREVNEKAIIIQWNEQWINRTDTEKLTEDDLTTRSILRLPYNIDVSDNFEPDVEFVEYTGREEPVSYYGTQIGHTSNWSVVIPRTDIDTLNEIRRLAIYKGDVYVREPSGTGYWANVKVSYSQTHCELSIPIQFSVTRVEGGM